MDPFDLERGVGPEAVAASDTDEFCGLMYTLAGSFADPDPLDLDFRALNSRTSIFNADDAGAGGTLTELYVAGVLGFTKDVLINETSPHYRLASTRGLIEQYLTFFEITRNGPDLLKCSLAFGMALSLYFKNDGERHILSALARMRTLRVMRCAASEARPDQVAPAKVMVEKLQKIWKEEEHERLTGLFGTYMLFKTWSLPGEVSAIPPREQAGEPSEDEPPRSRREAFTMAHGQARPSAKDVARQRLAP